jgi:hypothetical protein
MWHAPFFQVKTSRSGHPSQALAHLLVSLSPAQSRIPVAGQLFDAVVHEAKRAAKEDKADEESHWRSMEDDADMASTQTQQGSSLRCDLTSSDDDDDDDYEHVVWPTHCDSLLRAEGQGQQHVGWRAWVDLAWELQDEYVDGIHQLFNR